MEDKYYDWIGKYKNKHDTTNKCEEVTKEMVAEFPELSRKRGTVRLLNSEDDRTFQHWWCVDPDGEIIDPTESQYPFQLIYDEWDENRSRPTGKCLNCGNVVSNFEDFCNDNCMNEFKEYLEKAIASMTN